MTAFDRFEQFTGTVPQLTFEDEDGDYLAAVLLFKSMWSWSVWYRGECLEGERGWNLSAHDACEKALACIEQFKARDRRPYFAEEI
jgi:hypothetical protein